VAEKVNVMVGGTTDGDEHGAEDRSMDFGGRAIGPDRAVSPAMRMATKLTFPMLGLLVLMACGQPEQPTTPAPAQAIPEVASAGEITVPPGDLDSARLAEMVDAWFEEYLALHPVEATYIGDHRYDDRYENWLSAEHRDSVAALSRKYLAMAGGLRPENLGDDDRLTLRLFVRRLNNDLQELNWPRELIPFSQYASDPAYFAELGSGESVQPFDHVADYDNFLARMDGFLALMDTAIINMRVGAEKGVVQPTMVVEHLIPQVSAQVVENPEESIFFAPIAAFPDSIPADQRVRLEAAYRDAIINRLVPAYARLAEFLEDEYLPAARNTVGWDALPGGAAWYDFLVAYHTTTDMTAEEIHALGLAEVDRIRGEMLEVARQQGFGDDLDAFFLHLRTDPALYWTDPEAILADYRAVEARVMRGMPRLFGVFPTAGFEIRPVQEFLAESSAGASYEIPSADGTRPGVFYLNVWRPDRFPRWEMETLFLHEAIPGHHFQGALLLENESLPRFRRFDQVTAYSEGWALYSEDLGRELGMFEDPYQWFGKLNDEMFRAMRLVVDTGLHRYGWTREQAIEYMRLNSSLPEGEIEVEVERYIANPGQALAYKVGQLRFRQLRSEAEATLGESFDLRAWHDYVLSLGDVPMSALTERSRAWVREQQRRE
jgi:uncharacterized protein (DUF885 family)